MRVAEPPALQRRQGQQTPDSALHLQHASHAVMNLVVCLISLDQSVIGVGQCAVGVKALGLPTGQQPLKTRVIRDLEAAPQGVAAQTLGGQGQEHLAIQLEQSHGIAGKQRAGSL